MNRIPNNTSRVVSALALLLLALAAIGASGALELEAVPVVLLLGLALAATAAYVESALGLLERPRRDRADARFAVAGC